MANDYYTNVPPVEKSSSSVIDPGLFAGSLTAALDAAAKQTNVALGMSNQADARLFAQQEQARREAEARIEQQQRDLEQSNMIRAQTAYQEETTKYLARVQDDAVKYGKILSPEEIEQNVKQIGGKYLDAFKTQTQKASFESMISQNALSASGNAVAMNEKVVKDQALTTLKYIQDDAAKKFIQDPSRGEEVLLESQQRLSQLPLSKEMKFAADLSLQQAFGDNYLNNLAATDPDRFIEEFRSYNRPATPEGLKQALGTAQKVYKDRQKEIVDFSTVTTISANNSLKEHRAMGDTFLSKMLGDVPVQAVIADPSALNKVMSDYVDMGARVLPQTIHDTIVNLSTTPDAQSIAIASQTYETLKANPLTAKLLSSLPDEVAINLELYKNAQGSSLEDKLANYENQKKGNKLLKDASPEIQKLDSSTSLAEIFGDELGFNKYPRFFEDDNRFNQAAADVRRLRSEALTAGKYSENEVKAFIVHRLRGMYSEVKINGELQLVKGGQNLPEDVDKYIAPMLQKLDNLNLNIKGGLLEDLKLPEGIQAPQGNVPFKSKSLKEGVSIEYVDVPIGDANGYFMIRVGDTLLRELDDEGNSLGPVMIKNYKDQGEAALVKLGERAPELTGLKAKEEAVTKAAAALDGSRITGEVAPMLTAEEQKAEKQRVDALTGGFQRKNPKIDIQVK